MVLDPRITVVLGALDPSPMLQYDRKDNKLSIIIIFNREAEVGVC